MPTEEETRVLQQHRIWEDWAQADPLWAILSDPARKGRRWNLEEFFTTGTGDVRLVLDQLAAHGIPVRHGRCLDFGCGVGRLTQAMAAVFADADGVDISETMIDLAGRHNRFGERCQYHVNVAPDLSLFADGTFDFIFTTMVLQHIPAQDARAYIEEFVRILAPAGVAVFDMTSHFKDAKLPDLGHRARVTRNTEVPTLSAGQSMAVEVEVQNISGADWPAGVVVTLGNHWRRPNGKLVALDDGRSRFALNGMVAGESERVWVSVTAPAEPGRYVLEFDPVEEGVTWFSDRGSTTSTVPVKVAAPTAPVPSRVASSVGARLQDSNGISPTGGGEAPVEVPVPSEDPAAFTMNGLPRPQVEETIQRCGARLVAAEPNGSSGPEWETYRYFVVRD